MSWTITENALLVDGKEVASFPFPIREAEEHDGVIVVILRPPPDVVYPDNVFGFVLNESRLWQIESNGYYRVPAPDVRVTAITREPAPPGQVWLYTWMGVHLRIELKTGRVVETRCDK